MLFESIKHSLSFPWFFLAEGALKTREHRIEGEDGKTAYAGKCPGATQYLAALH